MADDGFIGAVTSHGLNVQFAVQGNLEGENMLAGLLAYLVAVYIQGNGALVGINLYGSGAAGALHKALGTDVHKGFIAPPCFIQIEAVLLGFAVKGHKALVVHARLAALVTGVCSKVKHVPNVGGPHPGVALEAAQHVLMVLGLVFFGVVAAVGVCAVQVGHALRTVFAVAERAVGEAEMEEAHPQVVQDKARNVPAQVQVPADHIGNVGRTVEGAAHGVAGQGGQAGLVHLVAQVVQLAVVIQHVLLVLGGDGDLVGNAPAGDAGVVVVLDDQLFHLADGVLAAVGHVLTDVGDLGPNNHADLVAQIIEVLVVLIMSQADGVGTDLFDQGHVFVVHLAGDGVAQALAVLMAGNAVQRVRLAVQEEALLGVNLEAAHAKAGGGLIFHRAVHHKAGLAAVQVRILNAVPQVCVEDGQGDVGAFAGGNGVAGGVQQLNAHFAFAVVPGGNLNAGICALHSGGDADAGAAEVIQGEVVLADHHQADIAVDAAIEGEVSFLGVNAVVFAVVDFHGQLVFIPQQFGDVGAEGGVAAVVVADGGAVQNHMGAGVDAVKLNPDLMGGGVKLGSSETGAVDAGAAPVVIAAVLTVAGVPGVRQVHRCGGAVGAGEFPALHDFGDFSHGAAILSFCCYYCNEQRKMSQWVLHNRSFAWNKRFLPDKKITLAFVQYVQMQGHKSYT